MTARPFFLCALLAAGTCIALSNVGCSDNDRDHDRDRDRMSDRRSGRYDRGDEATYGAATIARDSRFDYGNRRAIPESAVRVREGALSRDSRINFNPERPGRVYVYDADSDRILWSGSVPADTHVTADPVAGVLVNDQAVYNRRLAEGHRYNLYFEPGR